MARMLNLQVGGAAVVVATLVAAELAALVLAAHPGSALAWYVNLEVFGVFERARAEPSPLRFLFGPATLPCGLALLAMVLAARLWRFRLGVAAAANLSFAFAVAVAFVAVEGVRPQEASRLASIAVRADSQTVVAIMLFASFVAFAVSHASYLGAIMLRRRGNA